MWFTFLYLDRSSSPGESRDSRPSWRPDVLAWSSILYVDTQFTKKSIECRNESWPVGLHTRISGSCGYVRHTCYNLQELWSGLAPRVYDTHAFLWYTRILEENCEDSKVPSIWKVKLGGSEITLWKHWTFRSTPGWLPFTWGINYMRGLRLKCHRNRRENTSAIASFHHKR